MNTQDQTPKTELEEQQAENQQAINPDVETIELDKPIKMGSIEIAKLDIRKPNIMALQGVKITDLMQGDVSAICTVIPRVSSPTLTKAQINQLEPSDLAQIGAALILFLQPSSVRAAILQQQ
ncbi:phage tail assembly protein [Acinetobacter baumannii]|uniref:phage tail assembly protein n=1 Tax=Acinetobacter baumannii TaxID=470 RepID=UPI0002B98586|nr:phage tail assembly protein [Acinetobacter baumannii]